MGKISIKLEPEAQQLAVDELLSVRDFIRWGVGEFNLADLYFGHGHASAWDEAVFLVLHAINLAPDTDQRVLDARLTTPERKRVVELLAKRINTRKPAAYLVNEAWFAGLAFFVDERVIIPRSPIAELIEGGFDPWLTQLQVTRILDLCTGSGCMAIAAVKAFPDAIIDAVDLSRDALDVCAINVEQHNLGYQVRMIHSDLFDNLEDRTYDLIMSNPPYVSIEEWEGLPDEYKHEPKLALQTGQDSLAVVMRILREAGKHLTEDGILVVEVGNTAEALVEECPIVPFIWLQFERGGHGVFLLTAKQLKEHQAAFEEN